MDAIRKLAYVPDLGPVPDDPQDIVVTGVSQSKRLAKLAEQQAAYLANPVQGAVSSAADLPLIYEGGPWNGDKVGSYKLANWVEPYSALDDAGKSLFGRYARNPHGEIYWQDFVSPDAWDRAQTEFALNSGANALVGIASDVTGGIYDTVGAIAGSIYKGGSA